LQPVVEIAGYEDDPAFLSILGEDGEQV